MTKATIVTYREDGDADIKAILVKSDELSDASFAAFCETIRLFYNADTVLEREDCADVISSVDL